MKSEKVEPLSLLLRKSQLPASEETRCISFPRFPKEPGKLHSAPSFFLSTLKHPLQSGGDEPDSSPWQGEPRGACCETAGIPEAFPPHPPSVRTGHLPLKGKALGLYSAMDSRDMSIASEEANFIPFPVFA